MTAELERQTPGGPPLQVIAPLEDAASLHDAASQVLVDLLDGTGDGWQGQAIPALKAHDQTYRIFVRVHRTCAARGLPGAADVLETALEVHDALCASLAHQVQTGDREAARASLAGHRDWSALMASQADLWSPVQTDNGTTPPEADGGTTPPAAPGPGHDRDAAPPSGPRVTGDAAPPSGLRNSGEAASNDAAPGKDAPPGSQGGEEVYLPALTAAAPGKDDPPFAASARPLPPALRADAPLVAPTAREAPHGPPFAPAQRARPAGRTLANTRVASLPGTALRNAWLIPAVLFVVLLFGALLAGLVILPPDGLNGFLDPIVVN